jgi:hypothetical protein
MGTRTNTKIPVIKITAEKKLELAENKIRNLEQELNEASECLKIYCRPDQVGGLAGHAIEHLKKWNKS